MKSLKIILFLLISSSSLLATANPLQEIQQSHISGNVPATFEEFSTILERDLVKYFSASLSADVTVKYELLRKGPTQSGVAYPKFYAWVKVLSSEKEIESGVVRVAAIEKTHVEVTSFVSKNKIIQSPKFIETIFPLSLCENIRHKAGIK